MQTAKEMAHQPIERLPDTATFDDILYEFYVRQNEQPRPKGRGILKQRELMI